MPGTLRFAEQLAAAVAAFAGGPHEAGDARGRVDAEAERSGVKALWGEAADVKETCLAVVPGCFVHVHGSAFTASLDGAFEDHDS